MKDEFKDLFGRVWQIEIHKYDPLPNFSRRLYRVSCESTGSYALDFNFFAAFEDINQAIKKAKTISELLPY